LHDPTSSNFGTVLAVTDRQTDGHTHDDSTCRASIALRGKKRVM